MRESAFVDVHNHCCEFSPDASQPLSERILEAKEQGLAGVVMTDHYDKDLFEVERGIPLPPEGAVPKAGEWIFYLPDYWVRLPEERRRLAEADDPFKLLIGIELGYAPLLAQHFRDLSEQYDFDCIIASVHSLEKQDVYQCRETLIRCGKIKLYNRYIHYMADMLEEMDYANVLGHFDYISRYLNIKNKKMYYREQSEAFDRLFGIMIERQVSLELNIGSQRAKEADGTPMGLPDPAILKRYRELGGELVSLGSDAHHAGYVGRHFKESADYLEALGFGYLTHFEKGQAVLTALR